MIADSSSLEGQFLVAMPEMGDNRFDKTVIFVCAHSDEGAMGFVINKPMAEPKIIDFFEQLKITSEAERENVISELGSSILYTGGPVEPGRGFVLHSSEYSSNSTLQIEGNVALTATLEILREISMGRGPEKYFITLGYSGWSAGQLEDEIAANGWLVCPMDEAVIFNAESSTKYNAVMNAMGINPLLLSGDSGHA